MCVCRHLCILFCMCGATHAWVATNHLLLSHRTHMCARSMLVVSCMLTSPHFVLSLMQCACVGTERNH